MPTALAHRSDPDTSFIAAEELNVSAKDHIKAIILNELAEEPMAAFELTDLYFNLRAKYDWPDCKRDGIAKRLSELHNEHRVQDSGRRVMSPYGRPAVVWELIS